MPYTSNEGDFLQHLFGSERMAQEEQKTTLLPEAILARLQEALPRFTRECPFKVGDVVQALPDAPVKSTGPEIVVEVLPDHEVQYSFEGDIGNMTYGAKLDMRIIQVTPGGDHIAPFWVESSNYELYRSE